MPKGKVKLEWQHSEDKKSVRVKFPEDREYSAADLQALVTGIATIREQTAPPIPSALDTTQAIQAMLDQPWYAARDTVSDVVSLAVRWPGIGWVTFAFSIPEATRLRDVLNGQLARPSTPPGPAH